MGGGPPKPFISLNGKSILQRTAEAFLSLSEIEGLIVLGNPEFLDQYQEALGIQDERIRIIPGGKTRQHSVCLGLEFIANNYEDTSSYLVSIHDAARCLIDPELIRLANREASARQAVTLGVPVTDSLKLVEEGTSRALKNIDRKNVVSIQTPQVFSFDLIYKQHQYYKSKARFDFTDDTALLEGHHEVYIVPGSKENIKITTKEDLLFAQAILSKI